MQSFGLIIISLIANQMWNGGAKRGFSSLLLYLGITYLIVNFLVIPYTNFSISNLSFIYEDMASSILATPKAYIILLTASYIASKMNLRYGWEFNGILIPSLLALQWYEPSKLIVTFFEAFLILGLGRLFLKLPIFANSNIERSRLLLFFFNISFVYKFILSLILLQWFPEIKVSDYFAFGYLLSTLLALKMFQKDIPVLVTRATLQTSAFALVFASFVGFALTFIDFSSKSSVNNDNDISEIKLVDASQEQLVIEGYSEFYQSRTLQYAPPTLQDLATYEQAFIAIRRALQSDTRPLSANHPQIVKASNLLASIQVSIIHTAQNSLVIKDTLPQRAGGLVLINLNKSSGITLEVPAPLNENGIADLGLRMFTQFNAKALIYSGSHRFQDPLRQTDMLNVPRSFFQIAHERLSDRNVLQLRGYTRSSARELYGKRFDNELMETQALPNQLWVKNSLPQGLNTPQLQASINNFAINWKPPAFSNRQREYSREGFAEIMLTNSGIRQLIAGIELSADANKNSEIAINNIYLKDWLLAHKQEWAGRNSELYQPAKLNELIFFDEQIISPLLNYIDGSEDNSLQSISRMAMAMGYRLIHLQQPNSDEHFIILTEIPSDKQRYWGTYIFRTGEASSYFVESPRPLLESKSFDYALTLFQDLNAKALLVTTSHARSNIDGQANILARGNEITLFNRVHQTLLRHYQNASPLVIQTRGLSANQWQAEESADVRLALWQNSNTQYTTPLLDKLAEQITASGLSYNVVNGEFAEAGHEDHYNLLSQYMPVASNADMATLWLAEDFRRKITSGSNTGAYRTHFLALGIKLQNRDLTSWVDTLALSSKPLPKAIKQQLSLFIDSGDIIRLANALDLVKSQPNLTLEYVQDSVSKLDFIALTTLNNASNLNDRSGQSAQRELVALASIAPLKPNEQIILQDGLTLQQFIKRQSGWLLVRGVQ